MLEEEDEDNEEAEEDWENEDEDDEISADRIHWSVKETSAW